MKYQNHKLAQILFNVFYNSFECRKIPSLWLKYILNPIPKSQKNDPRVNDNLTNWFPTPSGVKQGGALSPTLFAVYINDLTNQIKQVNCGVKCRNEHVCVLLYADDIVLMAETEVDLQRMLRCISNWCKKWTLSLSGPHD